MGRGRRRRRQERQSSPSSDIVRVYENPGTVRLLFETPSGFAVFSLLESYLKKDIEHIWTYFIGDFWCNNILWLHEFRKFEHRPNAINLTTRKINPCLIKMILKYINFEEKLAVGRPEYKEIIEESLDVSCLYNDAVMEVMWGMQNLLRTILPQEQSEMTMEKWIPMSKGLDMVLRRHGFVVEPKMINEDIIEMANAMYDIDLRERAHSKFLHNLLHEEFMAISGVNIEKWSLLKLATVVKKMCYPDEGILVGNPYEMFSRRDAEVIEYDAAKYREVVDENTILTIYSDVVFLGEEKRKVRNKLRRLVREAEEALEAEEVLEEPVTTGVNSKQKVDHTCLTINPPAVPNQSNIGEGQHSIDCMKNISLHDTSANHSMRGAEVQTSIMFLQGVPAELTTVCTSGEINALGTYVEGKDLEKEDENTTVKQAALSLDGCNVGKNTVGIKKQAQDTGAGIEVRFGQKEHGKTKDSAYVEEKMLEMEDENTNVEEIGATPGGDNVGNSTFGVMELAQQTGTETEVILEKTEDSAYAEKRMLEMEDENTIVEETGATQGGGSVGDSTVDATMLALETGTENEVILENREDGAYVEKKMPEKKDEDNTVKETMAAPGGDSVGNSTVDVTKLAKETGTETEVIFEKTEDGAYMEENMAVKKVEDTIFEETGATPGGDSVGNRTVDVTKLAKDTGTETEVILETEDGASVEEKMLEKKDGDTIFEETGATPGAETKVIVGKQKHSRPTLSSGRTPVSQRILLNTDFSPSPVPPHNNPQASSPPPPQESR